MVVHPVGRMLNGVYDRIVMASSMFVVAYHPVMHLGYSNIL